MEAIVTDNIENAIEKFDVAAENIFNFANDLIENQSSSWPNFDVDEYQSYIQDIMNEIDLPIEMILSNWLNGIIEEIFGQLFETLMSVIDAPLRNLHIAFNQNPKANIKCWKSRLEDYCNTISEGGDMLLENIETKDPTLGFNLDSYILSATRRCFQNGDVGLCIKNNVRFLH